MATCLPLSRLLAGLHDRHLFAVDERVGRILDHLVAGVEAADDLHRGAVVLADDDRNQVRDVSAVDHGAERRPSRRKMSAAAGTMNVGRRAAP